MCALVIGHECALNVVLLCKCAQEIGSHFVELTVEEGIGLAQRHLGSRIYCVGVGGVTVGHGVVSVQRYGATEGAFNAVIVVEGAANISREAFYPWHIPSQVHRHGVHLAGAFDISSQTVDVDKGVASVNTCQVAVAETIYLKGRIRIGCRQR